MADTAPSLSPVLLTGGCGFIASHIIEHLLQKEPTYEIHVLDIDTSRSRRRGASYHEGDISSASFVQQVVKQVRPRVIFHTVSPDSMVLNDARFNAVIVDGTRHLLAAVAKVGTVRALFYTSTSSVIHDNLTELVDADETLPILRPPAQQRVYTLAKATAEAELLAANRADGDSSMLSASIRPALVFGERDTMGAGKNLYDFVYVGNLVDAHLQVARALLAAYGKPPPPAGRRVDGENFNITNDQRMLFWDFSRRVAALAEHPVKPEEVVVIPAMLGLIIGWISEWVVWILSRGTRQQNMTQEGIRFTTMERTLNVDKAKRVLGYRPTVSMEEGIERTVTYFLDEQKKTK